MQSFAQSKRQILILLFQECYHGQRLHEEPGDVSDQRDCERDGADGVRQEQPDHPGGGGRHPGLCDGGGQGRTLLK